MEREIEFRGKGIGTGGSADGSWRYGLLCTEDDRLGIQWKDGPFNYWQPIDTATIGQYIGRMDKSGRKIYEKDVVMDSESIIPDKGIVRWDDAEARFYIDGAKSVTSGFLYRHWVVIGNTLEHPHILEAT